MQTIHADQAWGLLEARAGGPPMIGSTDVKVAVIDNVIEGGHPDLDGQVEGNTLTSGATHHGTRVAGLIAAKHNNGGIAGVAPNTRLIPFIYGDTYVTANAVVDAVAAEAKIISLSRQFSSVPDDYLPNKLCHAICNFRLVVAAAGNMESPCTSALAGAFPAQYNDGSLTCDGTVVAACSDMSINARDGLLAVGAIDLDRDDDQTVDTDTTGVIAKFLDGSCSNVAPWIDIYAPGDQIKTTDTGLTRVTANGTSFATPLVAGAAAVVWGASPTLTNTDVEARLKTRGQALDLTPSHQVHPLLTGKTAAQIIAIVGGDRPVLDLLTALETAPLAADNTVTANEDTPYTFIETDFNFSDEDTGDTLTQVQITTLETVGSLQLSGADVVLNQMISVNEIINGNLKFTLADDGNGVGYDSFGFKVYDGFLPSDNSYTMTIDVIAGPLPPPNTPTKIRIID